MFTATSFAEHSLPPGDRDDAPDAPIRAERGETDVRSVPDPRAETPTDPDIADIGADSATESGITPESARAARLAALSAVLDETS